jgi:hypothetical protein
MGLELYVYKSSDRTISGAPESEKMVEFVVRLIGWILVELFCCFTGVVLVAVWRGLIGKSPSDQLDDRLCTLVGMAFWFLLIFLGSWLYWLLFLRPVG